jgi:hypothetical protein
LCFSEVSAFSGKTLQELWDNIQTLEEQSSTLDKKWEDFKLQSGSISTFLKRNLSDEEKILFQDIVSKYSGDARFLEQNLIEKIQSAWDTTDVKVKLIELKKQYYKDIASYVSAESMVAYLDFIRSDIELNQKNREIQETLYKDKIHLQEKVEILRGKIEENNQILENRIEQSLREKIGEKIQAIKNDSRFSQFSSDQKKILFEKTLERVIKKRQLLENEVLKTSLLEKKILLYKLVEVSILQEIRVFIPN